MVLLAFLVATFLVTAFFVAVFLLAAFLAAVFLLATGCALLSASAFATTSAGVAAATEATIFLN
ncbi:hypothetical protein CJ230_09860 [Oligella urethralis]|nr:hypothetical protein CJ230_09860 [Oligella urethralis]